jgi:outer membrane murein-binding lipoprotein Lpp
MPILAVALICWIVAGCLGIGFMANQLKNAELLATYIGSHDADIGSLETKASDLEDLANLAKDTARSAKQAADANARALTDHLEQVYAWRAAREKAALQPSKPRRRHHP